MRHDWKHAVRRLARDWQFTLAAVLILTLGIGINTAIFSVVNSVLFRKQPFATPERIVNIYQNAGDRAQAWGVSYPAFRDIVESREVFDAAAAILPDMATYQGQEDLRFAVVEYITSGYLDVAGYRVTAGRWLNSQEDTRGADAAAVVGFQTWQKVFHGDYGILGRTVRLNGSAVRVVGIGPREIRSAYHPMLITDFWLSMSATASVGSGSNRGQLLERRRDFPFEVRARLRDGVSVEQAGAAMGVLGKRLAQDYPAEDPGKGITLLASSDVVIHPREQDTIMKVISTTLLTIVGLVLAIACGNLATLLLVRGTGRAKEVSVRLAIGATRWQLIRPLLAEGVLLSIAGAALGLVLADWTMRFLVSQIPISFDLQMDLRVLAFTVALSVVTGIGLGLAPALRSTRVDVVAALKGEGQSSLSLARGWFTLKNGLLVGQIAGSFVLLMGTGFLIQEVSAVQSGDPGFAVEGVALVSTNARYAGYGAEDSARIYAELRRRIRALPGVQAAFAGSGATLTAGITREIELETGTDTQGNRLEAESAWAAPGYFETLQIPVLFGRAFQEEDGPGKPAVAIVNATMAQRVFGTQNAVGRRFRYGGLESSQEVKIGVEVVGVVRDTANMEPGKGPQPLFFLPVAQTATDSSTFVARTGGDAAALVQAMQREIRAVDSALPVLSAQTMRQRIDDELLAWRGSIAFVGAMGAVGLLLMSVGLYAVVRFAVTARGTELGIRMALGARRGQVVWLVMRETALVIGVSMAIGCGLSIAGLIALRASLVQPGGDGGAGIGAGAWTILGVLLATASVSGLAAYFPARHAADADPSVVLRQQ